MALRLCRAVRQYAAPRNAAGPRGAAAPKPAPTWLALWWGAMLSSRTADRRSTAPTDRRSMGGAGLQELRERMRGLCERCWAVAWEPKAASLVPAGQAASPWPGSKVYWASACAGAGRALSMIETIFYSPCEGMPTPSAAPPPPCSDALSLPSFVPLGCLRHAAWFRSFGRPFGRGGAPDFTTGLASEALASLGSAGASTNFATRLLRTPWLASLKASSCRPSLATGPGGASPACCAASAPRLLQQVLQEPRLRGCGCSRLRNRSQFLQSPLAATAPALVPTPVELQVGGVAGTECGLGGEQRASGGLGLARSKTTPPGQRSGAAEGSATCPCTSFSAGQTSCSRRSTQWGS